MMEDQTSSGVLCWVAHKSHQIHVALQEYNCEELEVIEPCTQVWTSVIINLQSCFMYLWTIVRSTEYNLGTKVLKQIRVKPVSLHRNSLNSCPYSSISPQYVRKTCFHSWLEHALSSYCLPVSLALLTTLYSLVMLCTKDPADKWKSTKAFVTTIRFSGTKSCSALIRMIRWTYSVRDTGIQSHLATAKSKNNRNLKLMISQNEENAWNFYSYQQCEWGAAFSAEKK